MSIASQTFCPNAPLQPNGSLPWIIEPPLARSLSKAWRCPSSDAFARELVPWAKAKHPKCKGMASCFTPISNYRCYAVLLGETGSIYLGLNVEIPGTAEATTLHAEQFASLLSAGVGGGGSRLNETGLISLAQRGTGAPCGHCRQWLAEFADAPKLVLLGTAGTARPMSAIFVDSFGPLALNNTCPLLSTDPRCVRARAVREPSLADPLSRAAVKAALASYSPYAKRRSGVALRTSGNKIYASGIFESVALNPSVQPVVAALVDLIVRGGAVAGPQWGSSIVEAVHAEEEEEEVLDVDVEASGDSELFAASRHAWPSYVAHTRSVLRSLAPNATVRVVPFAR